MSFAVDIAQSRVLEDFALGVVQQGRRDMRTPRRSRYPFALAHAQTLARHAARA